MKTERWVCLIQVWVAGNNLYLQNLSALLWVMCPGNEQTELW